MKIHLFGLPLSLHRRLKEESSDWVDIVPAGHSFRATPIFSNDLGPFTAAELEELCRGVSDGFTHVVLPANRNWGTIRKRLQFDCRIHLARLRQPLRDLTLDILKEALRTVATIDGVWLDKFCPKDLRHALLLPPPIFATNRETAEYWRHCDAYSIDRFASAEKLLEQVERYHRRPDGQSGGRSWLDSRSRRYRIDPARHGRSTADREKRKSYRFCYEVPPGFHYDLTEDSGKPFKIEIEDRDQTLTHCNVTPWGVVRQG
jgi:hypothetical protein